MKNNSLPLILIVASILTEMASTDILLPSLPLIASYFSVDTSLAGLIISCNLFGLAISGIIYGWLSDILGRRPIFVVGNFLFFCGSVFCILSHDIVSLILARFIQGMGGGVCATLGLAVLRDQYDEQHYVKIISWVGILLTSSPVIFPLLGGYLSVHYSWQVSFYLVMLSSFTLTLLIYFYLPETFSVKINTKLSVASFCNNYKQILLNPEFFYYASMCALTYASTWVYLAIMPLFMVNVLHYTPLAFGLLISLNVAANVLGTAVHTRLVACLTSYRLLLIGINMLLLSGFSFVLAAWFCNKNIWLILITTSIYWIGTAFVFPNSSQIALSVIDHLRGAASSALISLEMSAGSLAIACGTLFYSDSMRSTATITLLLSLLVTLAFYRVKAKHKYSIAT